MEKQLLMAHMACQNFWERNLWVRPNNQAWFDMADIKSLPSPFLWQPRVLYSKNHDKKDLERTNFLARCLVYPCRDYLLEVDSAPLKFWAPVPHYVWDRYVYSPKLRVPCLKIVSTAPKFGVPCHFFSVCKWGFNLHITSDSNQQNCIISFYVWTCTYHWTLLFQTLTGKQNVHVL